MNDWDDTWDGQQEMPAAWWRFDGALPLRVRYSCRAVSGHPLLVFSDEFYDDLHVIGTRYVDLYDLTWCDTDPHRPSPGRAAFDALTTEFPNVFSTVIGAAHNRVWLALRLIRLTDDIADRLLSLHAALTPGP